MQEDANILVVDDESVVIRSCERVLREEGYSVRSVLSAKEAMSLLEKYAYNLVIIDLKMPEIDGITLINWAKKLNPDMGIVVITAYPSQQTIQESLNLGCIDYVPKPFTPTMLTDVIRSALGRIKKQPSSEKFSPATDIVKGCFYIKGGDITNAGAASKALRTHLMKLGIPFETTKRAATSAFEAEMNVIIHAMAGILFYIIKDNKLRITVKDIGPGIENIEMAMKEGYSTAPHWSKQLGWGTGMGLSNIKNNSDSFRITSVVDEGTTLEIIVDIKGS